MITNLTYPRSSIKIFQAIPFIKSKAYEKYQTISKTNSNMHVHHIVVKIFI